MGLLNDSLMQSSAHEARWAAKPSDAAGLYHLSTAHSLRVTGTAEVSGLVKQTLLGAAHLVGCHAELI